MRAKTIQTDSVLELHFGEPVSSERLKSYQEALAQYLIHPEAKFRNGDYLDSTA
jgi:hypothetical protein